ncbi:probable pectinesterase/pectinesterase inhibitor VGDH2 [Pistacia vera]|uniref:probable pectinesterase/pectinesterase inhibitor VGDH2 n=1 Tax=Pistacia vera TaxID=55513 RepID=UPI0012631637|nr:probable pectinesterase/pectinesterase inhibitor VGDH2 [Pistacia vera]
MAVEITLAFRKLLRPTQSTDEANEIYNESVTVSEKQQNLFMYGDGNSKTIVPGTGFIAKVVGFVNTAGSNGHQAMALHVASDYSTIFDCRIDGYQTSLYAHAYRQFYHNCKISGTIGLIFGDATVIIQSSTLIVRKSNDKVEKYAMIAPVRSIRQQTTTMVIHNYTIVLDEKLFPDRLLLLLETGGVLKE